jgi:hypothetical protein
MAAKKHPVKGMICIQCSKARFVSGVAMCRNDGRIFCEKLQKLVDKYQKCEATPRNNKEDSKKANH